MTRDQFSNNVMLLILFLLPWQTVRIVNQFTLDGEMWEYGKFTIFAVELLVFLMLFLRKRHEPLSGLGRPIGYGLLLLGGAFISLTFSESAALGLGSIFHLASAFGLFYLLLDHRLKTTHLVFAFLLGLMLPSFLGWVQVLTGSSPASTLLGLASHEASVLGQSVVETQGDRVLRAYGSFPHPNVFGGFLAVACFCAAWLSHQRTFRRFRVALMLPVMLLSSTLIMTFSRSSWLGLATGVLVLLAFMLWEKKVPPRNVFPLASIGLISLVITLLVFHTAVFTRFTPGARLEAQSLETRSGEYQQVFELIKTNPVTGVGIGQYTLALAHRYPGGAVYVYQPMHNTLLLIFAELGIIGSLLVAIWVYAIDHITWKVRHTASGMFALGLGSILLVLALLDHYPWSSWPGLALMAVSFALILRWSKEAEPVPDPKQRKQDA